MTLICLLILTLLLSNCYLSLGQPSGSAMASSTYGRDRFNMNSKCIDPETGRELYIGDSFTRSGRCIKVQCLDSLQLWEDRCQVPRLEKNCNRLPAANEFLDYPRCCPTYECKSYKTDDNSITDETRTYDHYGRLLREDIMQRVRVMEQHHPIHMTAVQNGTDGRTSDYGRRTESVFKIN